MPGRMRRSTVDKAFLPNASRSRWVVPDLVHVPESGGIGPSAYNMVVAIGGGRIG